MKRARQLPRPFLYPASGIAAVARSGTMSVRSGDAADTCPRRQPIHWNLKEAVMNPTVLVPVLGLAGLVASCATYWLLRGYPSGSGPAPDIDSGIHDGAVAFLGRAYAVLAVTAAALTLLLFLGFQGWYTPLAFVVGVLCSASIGYGALHATVRAGPRAVEAARAGDAPAVFVVTLLGGSVPGSFLAAMGLLGLGSLNLLLGANPANVTAIHGFGLGIFTVAWFCRVGGGLFANSAGLGLELASSQGGGTPKYDDRHAGEIASRAGMTVADTAGMGSDLFGSWCGAMIATVAIASTLPAPATALIGPQHQLMFLPLALGSIGLLCAVSGMGIMRLAARWPPKSALRTGAIGATVLFIATAWLVTMLLDVSPLIGLCISFGALAGPVIALAAGYYTSGDRVRGIARAGDTGPATVLIRGLATGMASVALPVLTLAAVILTSGVLMPDGAGAYGIGAAAVGMSSTVGIVMTVHAFGPVAGNAAGLATMARLDPRVRGVTDALDQAGQATAAPCKGLAIGMSGVAALALIAAFIRTAAQHLPELSLRISEPGVLIGLLMGAGLPLLVSACTLRAVGEAALDLSREDGRLIEGAAGQAEGTAKPDHDRMVGIAARWAIRRLALPGLLALLAPVAVGLALGAQVLAGMLGGALVVGVLMAVAMTNVGGAWSGARLQVKQRSPDGKGSDAFMAAVVGGAVGDPLRDTAGPSLTILTSLMAVVSLVIAPWLAL